MFSVLRASTLRTFSARAFSTTGVRASDLSKLSMTGYLARDAEVRTTKNDHEYVSYVVSVKGVPSLGGKPPITYHTILSFDENSNKYLRNLKKGSRVYTEAHFELKEPSIGTDPSTPQGQRQIYLKHENIKVLTYARPPAPTESESDSEVEEVTSSTFV